MWYFFDQIVIYLSLCLHKGRPSFRRSLQHEVKNIQNFKKLNFLTFFYFCVSILPSRSIEFIESGSMDSDLNLEHCFSVHIISSYWLCYTVENFQISVHQRANNVGKPCFTDRDCNKNGVNIFQYCHSLWRTTFTVTAVSRHIYIWLFQVISNPAKKKCKRIQNIFSKFQSTPYFSLSEPLILTQKLKKIGQFRRISKLTNFSGPQW